MGVYLRPLSAVIKLETVPSMVIDAELFAPAIKAIDPGDPNNRVPCETVNATVSKPPAGNEASVKVMLWPVADEKMNAVFRLTVSLAGALTVGGESDALEATVSAMLADADNPSPVFEILTVSESEPTKFTTGV
jgi:hypothetical protein